jgi:hypothetical protein
MNNQPRVVSNSHHPAEHRHQVKCDMSEQLAHFKSYNFALTKMRDLARYRTVYSSKLNIFDNSRTTSPTNYFGISHIHNIDRTQLFSPAGMDMQNSTVQTGLAFTKPAPRLFQQAL